MNVLVVEKNPEASNALKRMLADNEIQCYATEFGDEAIDLVRHYHFNIILLNCELNDLTGIDVLRALRRFNVSTPVIVLSKCKETRCKLDGFAAGADDYITKPFQRDELLARIVAIVRRSKGHATSLIEIGAIKLDLLARTVLVDDIPVKLTSKEFQVLELLCLRKNTVVSKDALLTHLYGGTEEPEIKILDVFICKIRKKLEEASGRTDLVETVRGYGYIVTGKHAGIKHAFA